MLDQALVTAFIIFCVVGAVLVAVFFARVWMSSLLTSISQLNATIAQLTAVVAKLEAHKEVSTERMAQHRRELDQLNAQPRCTNPDCLYFKHSRKGDIEEG
jgi:outer membrane murein-binding lipoprotein Lpp